MGITATENVVPDDAAEEGTLPVVTELVPSGIRPVDHRMGGLLPGRPHVISGSPGTGKSISCVEFVNRGVERGETSLLITHDDPADVLASAAFLGIDMERALRTERVFLLRFQLDFVRRLGRATSPDAAFEEVRRLVGVGKLDRIAIDSVVPFLDAGPSNASTVYSLVQFLDAAGATSLLTFPGDMTGLYDRRLEPLMQRAAGVFHLSSDSERNHKLEVRKLRYQAPSTKPVAFRVMSGAGMVVIADADSVTPRDRDATRRTVLLVNMADALPPALLDSMRENYDVDVRTGIFSAFSEFARDGVGAVLLSVRRDVIDSALQLVRDMRMANNALPVALVTPYVLRSADRTRAIRAGVDDFLSSSLNPLELNSRLETIIQRGHWHNLISENPEPALILQPVAANSEYTPMTEDALRKNVRAYLERDQPPYFSLFILKAERGTKTELAQMALDMVRVESGDLVALSPQRVSVYLDSARPKDLVTLKSRLRELALRRGLGDLQIEAAGYPANEEQIFAFLGDKQKA